MLAQSFPRPYNQNLGETAENPLMSVTDDIKARLDIATYINQYVPLQKKGRYQKACCPFHSEKTPSFVVNEDQQSWRCFGACADGGDIFSFAMRYHGWDFKEALNELGKLAGIEVRQQSDEQKQRQAYTDKLRGILNEAAEAYQRKLFDPNDAGAQAALRYAREQRGLSDETIRAFGIGFAPEGWQNMAGYLTGMGYDENDIIAAGLASRSEKSGKIYDRFRNRLIVAIRDERGRVVGFGGRILDPDDSPKYLNSPQSAVFDKSQLLFGLDLAKEDIRNKGTAVIVEGYMDVITAHQAGFHNVVAQMGTAMTETQLQLIAPKWAKTIVLALDSDAAGQNATMRSLEVARQTLREGHAGSLGIDMRVLQIPNAKDPDDLIRETPEQWESLVKNAMSVADFVIAIETADLPDDAPLYLREEIARRLAPILLATENDLYQNENAQKLARRLLISERDLLRIAQAAHLEEEAKRQRQAYQPPPQQPSPTPRGERRQNLPPQPPTDTQSQDVDVMGSFKVTEEEPNFPEINYDDADAPPDDSYEDVPPPPPDMNGVPPPPRYGSSSGKKTTSAPPTAAAMPPPPPPQPRRTERERYVLGRLIEQPELYPQVNQVLNAGRQSLNNPHPIVFEPFNEKDFSTPDMQALMRLFLASLHQDDMTEQDFVERNLDFDLRETFELVMIDPSSFRLFDETRISPDERKKVDHFSRTNGAIVTSRRDVIAQALRLRHNRLDSLKHEIRLMQINAKSLGDRDEMSLFGQELFRLTRSVYRLEMETVQVNRPY